MEESDLRKALQKRASRLELLAQLGAALHSERDFDRLLDRIFKELTEVLEAERSSLFLVDDEANELYSVIAQKEAEIRFPRGAGIAGTVASTGRSVLIPDAYKDPRFNPEVDKVTGFRTRSMLTVPLRSSLGEVLGVAQVLNRRDGKPFDKEDQLLLEALASLSGAAMETLQLIEEQKQATEAVITGLIIALEMRVLNERQHAAEVRGVSGALARVMGMTERDVKLVEWAAALHDIGKLAVPDRVLKKTTSLNEEELAEYEKHASHTRELLQSMSFVGELAGVEEIAPYHHKKFAGGGYPAGPPDGPGVPMGSRIIAVADSLWVLRNPRWGNPPLSIPDAVAHIKAKAGTEFDPSVVGALCSMESKLEEILEEAVSARNVQVSMEDQA